MTGGHVTRRSVRPRGISGQRISPRSPRGIETRAALVAAARTVFERRGYVEARVSDIAEQAGVSLGSFYTYFEGKEAIFVALMEELQDEMLHPRLRSAARHESVAASLEEANRAYLLAYKRNARLMAVLEQVASIDEGFRELRRKRGAAFAERNARSIRALQEQGLADPTLNPTVAAHALGGMVGRLAWEAFVMGSPLGFEDVVQTATKLWLNALKVPAAQEPSATTAPSRKTSAADPTESHRRAEESE